ncbi:EAL domain-containing protein [Alkalibacillus silvisoli]|uniref:EAL domain-containing protein n=1 Tax=Alkalibacillus silvisoli TaxID=392823 RepID=A0ABN0ZNK4_9BACI
MSDKLFGERDFLQAIEEEQFKLVFQPQISLTTGQVIGIEALLRWQHPEHGWISPVDFIPIAEETGVITEITKWVLKKACQQNKAWHDQGLQKTVVSVNISPVDFENDELYNTVMDTLVESNLQPQYLELEITENVMMKDISQTINLLKKINQSGVRIAIDDFGKGNSTLAYIRDLPITTVKLDRSFMNNIPYSHKESTIVKNIIQMCHNLDLQIIAEGVETEEVVTFLSLHHCTIAQGFLFSKPLFVDDYEANITQSESEAIEMIYRLEEKVNLRSAQVHDHRFKSLFEQNPDLVCSFSLNGKVLSINPAVESLLGFKPHEVLNRDLDVYVQSDDLELTQAHLNSVIQGEEPDPIDISLVHKEGHIVSCNVTCFPMRLGGRVVGVYSVIKDTTKQKKLQNALKEKEQKYRFITENMSDYVISIDLKGVIQYASTSNSLLLGYDHLQMEGQVIFEFINKEDLNHVKKEFNKLIESKKSGYVEVRLQIKDGNSVWVEAHANPVLNDEGDVVHFVIVSRDISRRKKAELELQKTQRDLKNTLSRQQGMTIKFLKTNRGFVHTLCEGELMRKLGLTSQDVVGKTLYDFLPNELASNKEYHYSIAWNGQDTSYEAELNGIYYLAQLRPVFEGEKVIEVIGSCVDITEKKVLERELSHY